MNPAMGALFVFFIIFIMAFVWIDRIQLRKGEIKKSIFFIAPIYRLRVSLWILVLASLPIIAWYYQGWEMFYSALIFAIVLTFFLLIFYGMYGETDSKEMKITNFYSPRTLIFLAIFWPSLIGLIIWRLYVLAP